MKPLSIHSWDFRIAFAIYIVAWIWLNDYWLCFVGIALAMTAIYFILQWRANHQTDDDDDAKYQQRTKELLMVFILFFGALSYKTASWLIDLELPKQETQCGYISHKHIKVRKNMFDRSYIQLQTAYKSYRLSPTTQVSITDFYVNDKICATFIDENKSLWLAKHYVITIVKNEK